MTGRVAVIGAGAVGLCIAEQLAVSGAKVELVEREEPGAGATTRSFAWINATFDKQPRSYFELSRDAVACWRRWSAADPKLGVRWCGSVEWADTQGAGELARAVERHRSLGSASRPVSAEELSRLEPDVDSGDAEFACATVEEGVVDPARLVKRLVERCEAANVRIHRGESLQRATWQGEWQLELDGDSEGLACDAVVLAAGTRTQSLARQLGCDVPLVASPGVLVDVPAVKAPRGVVLSPDLHFRAVGEGTVRAGLDFGGSHLGGSGLCGPDLGGSDLGDEEVAAEIGRRLWGRLEGVDAEALRFVRGERPMPRDGLPVVGRLPAAGDLFVAVMHSGITLAPWVAELLSAEVVSGRQDPRLLDFRPSRFDAG